ncbi:MAG: hypothetical protein R2844_09075 [Caldilineales bacterium]
MKLRITPVATLVTPADFQRRFLIVPDGLSAIKKHGSANAGLDQQLCPPGRFAWPAHGVFVALLVIGILIVVQLQD